MTPSVPVSNKPWVPSIGLVVMAIVWLTSLILINPRGDFPLNDDWAYGLTVRHFLQFHEFCPNGWAAMSLFSNVLWGSLFCLPAGFSFTALRLSTLVAAGLGIYGVYWLARQARLPSWIAVLVALILAFNPVYYSLSNTFMTDVFFLTLMTYAAIFLLRCLQEKSDVDLAIGTAFAILAVLSRQFALAIPLAFAVALIIKSGFKPDACLRAAIPVLACGTVLFCFQRWLAATGRLSEINQTRSNALMAALLNPRETFPKFIYAVYQSAMYLGLFLSPVLICMLAELWLGLKKKIQPFLAVSLWLVLLGTYFYRQKGFFLSGSQILESDCLGPRLLRDMAILNLNEPPAFSEILWKIMTCLCFLGSVLLLAFVCLLSRHLIAKSFRAAPDENHLTALFLLLFAVIYLFPLWVTEFFDRYLITVIPFIGIGILAVFRPASKPALGKLVFPALILAGAILISVAGTRDYLAWNRLRWQAVNQLMKDDKVGPDDIDGGFEFNGFYLYETRSKLRRAPYKSWWWVHNDTYIISNGPMPGFELYRQYLYYNWFPSYTGHILILKKCSLSSSDAKGEK